MRRWFGVLALLLAAVVFGWFAARQMFGPTLQSVRAVPEAPAPVLQSRELLLYFEAPAGGFLETETRQVAGCAEDEACMAAAIRELLLGSQEGRGAVLPATARLNRLSVEGDLVRLDFSPELLSAHPGGSLRELLSGYALIDTLAVNFSYLKRLQVTVAGKPQSTLKGHIDLATPLIADFSYTRPPSPTAAEAELAPSFQEQVVPEE